MPRLLVTAQGPAGLALDIGAGTYRIGRSTGNDLQIDHPSISTAHCEVLLVNSALLVRDLGSTNGTFIDRRPIREACLRYRQVLQVGIVELMLEEPLRVSALPTPDWTGAAKARAEPIHGCVLHSGTAASFRCPRCNSDWCAGCVQHLCRMDGSSLRLCPACAVECDPIARLPEKPAFDLETNESTETIPGARSIRAGLFPHLAEWLKGKLVQGLISQRRQLLRVQAVATRQAEEFEQRLADVQVEMRQRIAAYEEHIAALEKQLAAAELEKRQLIRDQIMLIKRALAEERAQQEFSTGHARGFHLPDVHAQAPN